MIYQYATCSRLGNRQANEDRVGVAEHGSSVLLLLADGLGGHKGGDIAAQCAINTASNHFHRENMPVADPSTFLKELFIQVQLRVMDVGQKQNPPMEPKCTLVACLIQNGEATWAHAGDSRLYVIRQQFVIEQTRDHSVVEDLYRKGRINKQQKALHPQRNSITQCIGSRNRPVQPTLSDTISLQKYDVILLCSDGLWSQVNEAEIKSSFTKDNINYALEQLSQQAESNFYPRSDNVSAVAFRFLDAGGVIAEEFNEEDLNFDEIDDYLGRVINNSD